MVDEFENSAIPFNSELAQQIKTQIQMQLNNLRGPAENLEGYNRAKYLLQAQQLTGIEMKRLRNYIDSLPRDDQGRISDPAYAMIGGDALNTFIQTETERLRHQINKAEESQENMDATKKQDVTPPAPPETEEVTGLPKLDLMLKEELKRIKQIILH